VVCDRIADLQSALWALGVAAALGVMSHFAARWRAATALASVPLALFLPLYATFGRADLYARADAEGCLTAWLGPLWAGAGVVALAVLAALWLRRRGR
jgi:hypothetical protein